MRKFLITAAAAMMLVVSLAGCSKLSENNDSSVQPSAAAGESISESAETTAAVPVVKDTDLVIPVNEISETAQFYPVEVDGVQLEVIAVKAPDGTIRTAFNTCQVCFDSGRGYYKQEGGTLVCQNCGNRFGMDQVEVLAGGCNPVPIFPEDKTVDEQNITITNEFLKEASVIFENWKTNS